MPTVLTSGDREDVERRLTTSPPFRTNPPDVVVTIISWITAIITSLLNFVSLFLGVISDDVAALTERVAELEENTPHVAPATQPDSPTQLQQPPRPSCDKRVSVQGSGGVLVVTSRCDLGRLTWDIVMFTAIPGCGEL